ncbi:MAG: hypothetical protein QM645_06060 [Asticcacaulis sp.]
MKSGRFLPRMALIFTAGLSLIWASSVLAYGTIGMAGQDYEHQKITRLALNKAGLGTWTMDQLAGTDKTMGAVGAADNPLVGLVFRPEAHCDSGDHLDHSDYPQTAENARASLTACRKWIFGHLNKAVEIAPAVLDEPEARSTRPPKNCKFRFNAGSAKCRVLFELGLALHATQDFYAHSNWTDVTTGPISAENPPGLAQNGPVEWLNPAKNAPLPKGLISGCWQGIPEIFFCSQLSKHKRVTHATLSKDTGVIDRESGDIGKGTTKRGAHDDNFSRSVLAAITDTTGKWRYFENRIIETYGQEKGRRILCLIKSDSRDACQ